eukprot:6203074-Pleurochrysis_carterae.AAC.3
MVSTKKVETQKTRHVPHAVAEPRQSLSIIIWWLRICHAAYAKRQPHATAARYKQRSQRPAPAVARFKVFFRRHS